MRRNRRRATLAATGLLAACAAGAPEETMTMPDWNGPAVHCRHLHDGSMRVELVAPTAGYRFTLRDVAPPAPGSPQRWRCREYPE